MMYPMTDSVHENIMCHPLSPVRSLCHACTNTINHPTTYGATVNPCAFIDEKPRFLINCSVGEGEIPGYTSNSTRRLTVGKK